MILCTLFSSLRRQLCRFNLFVLFRAELRKIGPVEFEKQFSETGLDAFPLFARSFGQQFEPVDVQLGQFAELGDLGYGEEVEQTVDESLCFLFGKMGMRIPTGQVPKRLSERIM